MTSFPDSVSEADQLTLDVPVAPVRALPGQLLHQLADFLGTGGRPTALGARPFLLIRRRCQVSKVPESRSGAVAAGRVTVRQGSDHGSASPVRPPAGDLTAQDRDLMPEHEDLRMLGGLTSCQAHQAAEHPGH